MPALRGDAVSYEGTYTRVEAARHPVISVSNVEGFAEAELAEAAGFEVTLEVTDFSDENDPSPAEFVYGVWKVEIPPEVERQLMAAVWDGMEGPTGISYTLTRDTSDPNAWRLTSWARDGGPWGHAELDNATQAFDTSMRGMGTRLEHLAQVVFRDGRVLVREGAKRIETNPGARGKRKVKNRLMR